jgi:hypothetical protein
MNIISDADSYCTSCSDAESEGDAFIDLREGNTCANSTIDNEIWVDEVEGDGQENPVASRFRVSSTVQANHLLSDASINAMLIGEHCLKGRKCSPCPNDGDCGECFGAIKSAREVIKAFRKKYWDNASDVGQIFLRRKQLLQDIDTMKVLNKENSQITIQYKIDGVFVCKSFFYVSVIIHSLFNISRH